MKFLYKLAILLIFFTSQACLKKEIEVSQIKENNQELEMISSYREAMKTMNDRDYFYAAKKFLESEILFPQSDWAPKAALMAAYSYYSQDYYGDAIAELDRFIRVYPKHVSLDYAYYLLAICYYEQIVDEKKDLQSIIKAKDNFKIVINKFPITEYASDSKFKIDLINDVLASKEMYIGRYYFEKKKWIPAINRFRTVIDDYQTTIYTEEALHRLVEVYYILGLKKESKKYANLLGYNYQSSDWYEKSYSVFDKQYKKRKINSEKKGKGNPIINKMISLF
jgi:outer membrane protein assembly factor BamD